MQPFPFGIYKNLQHILASLHNAYQTVSNISASTMRINSPLPSIDNLDKIGQFERSPQEKRFSILRMMLLLLYHSTTFYRKSLHCCSDNGCGIPINAHFYQYKITHMNPFHLHNRLHFSDKSVLVGEVYDQCDNCFKKVEMTYR